MRITALLVSHNGARWLPTVLDGLARSTRRPDAWVAVDTGSEDDSPALVASALGVTPVSLPPETTFAEAVRQGLAAAPPVGDDDWVWLLHDDATPTPGCLEQLVEAISAPETDLLLWDAEDAHPEPDVLGPELLEWPSLRRLLEVGVTISGTGRRETGLEPGEYDQGQHDAVRHVLAVNTAGMLVRREVLEEVGLDDLLPVLGTDLDFGWRAALAGHRTVTVPRAKMHHLEATRRGRRRTTLVPHAMRAERAGAITTLLANSPAALVPVHAVRLLLGSILRTIGFLLVRAVPEARDELAAVARVYLHPGRIAAARRARRGRTTVPRRQVRTLLPSFWLPYRHGVDFVVGVATALVDEVRDAATRPDEHGRTWGGRLLTSPVTWAALGLTVLALVANRDLLQGAPLHGGALLGPPDGVGHWWALWSSGWHWLGTGSAVPAPAYVLVLALGGTVLLGATGGLMWLLFVLTPPLATLSAHRFTRRVMPGQWAAVWAALTYGLLPVVSGAVGQGRLGTVAAALVLPFVATSALGLGSPDEERRSRAAWRTALGASVLVAFVPSAILWLVLVVLVLPWLTGSGRGWVDWRHVSAVVWLPLLLTLPWVLGTLGTPQAWLVEAGRAGVLPDDPGFTDLVLGRLDGAGVAPAWFGAGLPLAALVALVRPDTRAAVTRAWLVTATAAVLLGGLAWVRVELPGVDGAVRPSLGFLVLVVQAGFVVAAGIAAAGAVRIASEASFGWRQVVGGVALVAALAAPVLGAAWWLVQGDEGPLTRGTPATLPAYMTELSAEDDSSAVLVLRGGAGDDVRYEVLRDGTLRVGDDGVLSLTPERRELTGALGQLLAGSGEDVSGSLAEHGIAYVYAPRPVSAAVSGALDAAAGFTGASAPTEGTRAWRVEGDVSLAAVEPDPHPWHLAALAVQVVAVVAAVVLALPGRRRR